MTDEERIEAMIKLLRELMEKEQNFKYMKRAAHAKSLGLLKGYLTVSADLPERLRIGAFAAEKTYPAWIRFSNANPKAVGDQRKDVRGVAIKLLDDGQPDFPQDFILASCSTIPFGTWAAFYEVLYWGLRNPVYLFFKMLLQGNLKKFITLYRMMRHDSSPLDISYFSVTPYAFGEAVIKYVLRPTSEYQSALPKTLTESYLSESMRRHLLRHDATFDFCVQFQQDDVKTPLEDCSVEWKEADAPFIKVAQLRIPAQNFKADKRSRLSEMLAYSPDHGLEAHRALGAINEARCRIYRELSAFRHVKNRMPEHVPTESEFHAMQ